MSTGEPAPPKGSAAGREYLGTSDTAPKPLDCDTPVMPYAPPVPLPLSDPIGIPKLPSDAICNLFPFLVPLTPLGSPQPPVRTGVNAPVCTTGFDTIAKGFGRSGRGWFKASTFGGSM